MTQTPKISVVIPVYNGEETIKETIQSILNQTFEDFEIVVINDGSNDSTLEIISTFKDRRLNVFSSENSGLSAARNRGITNAKGEYISFIDADDMWTEHKLEEQLKALQSNSWASVAYSWTNFVNENGKFLRSGCRINANGDVFLQLLRINFIQSGSNLLVKTKALARVGNFDESLDAVEDWDMWLRLAESYQFVCVPLPQILYRVSSSSTSMSSQVLKMEQCILQVIEKTCNNTSRHLSKDLKSQVFAEQYRYLTTKALDGYPEPRKGQAAVTFFIQAIRYDPSWLHKRKKLISIIIFKMIIFSVLPTNFSRPIIKSLKNRFGQKTP
ncbi:MULTISPECIES: glycosyltransferase family 2 protein [unclassified Roseofilum]|uniref:glycosyltransferase family 2 protein n=1 Tax=unclassified Roseofilum TaxID=2620099 RepID=UPI000E82B92B|nr:MULTISPECIES: glycosyltransferase [unclassified Roseofilum]MBP0008502.1 glycosyltransferase [Roseofilum sp. Belize Diploria]MBP0033001.1 glycosyltransferase [Roseofilum sp. Belize BBD 4]HBQ97955.1 glycosyl transferase family A [Cyanobacteria bacterium UBA11691]